MSKKGHDQPDVLCAGVEDVIFGAPPANHLSR